MKGRCVIKKEDSDIYYFELPTITIMLPFSKLGLEHFVLGELEKVHPFFGTHCKVDIRIVIQKARLYAMATVVDIEVLSNYKNKKPKTCLFVFEENSKKYYTVFRPKKIIHKNLILIFIVCILITAIACLTLLPSNYNNNADEVFNQSSKNSVEDIPILMHLFNSQLHEWLESGAMFTSIIYTHTDNIREKNTLLSIDIAISGLYPEEVLPQKRGTISTTLLSKFNESIIIHPIIFENDVPNLKISFTDFQDVKNNVSMQTSEKHSAFVRKIILNHNGKIKEENWERSSFNFILPIENWELFSIELKQELRNKTKTFEQFSFSCEKNGTFVDSFIMIKNGPMDKDIVPIEYIFSRQSSLQNKTKAVVNQMEQPKNINENYEGETIIGSVSNPDGSALVFYITQGGEIIVKE